MRKVAVAISHRTPYGRLKPVLRAIKEHPGLQLQTIVFSPVFMTDIMHAIKHSDFDVLKKSIYWYIKARAMSILGMEQAMYKNDLLTRLVKDDGFEVSAHLPVFVEGGSLSSMTKSVATGILGLPKVFEKLQPDIVLIHADRFEMLSVATAASLMNIPIAHTQGGDVSGTIDETVRHAISKMAHIHFPTTLKSKERLIRMGEDPKYVHFTGCPTIDSLNEIDLRLDDTFYDRNSIIVGNKIDFSRPFILLLHHPVTTEYEKSKKSMTEILTAIERINIPTFLFGSNIDAGSDGTLSAIRDFLKNNRLKKLLVHKNLSSEDFYRVLNAATVAVGNSSSFIREGSYLGVPAVIIGSRQQNRECADNICTVDLKSKVIEEKIRDMLKQGRYKKSNLYGEGGASKAIAEILANTDLYIQKKFVD